MGVGISNIEYRATVGINQDVYSTRKQQPDSEKRFCLISTWHETSFAIRSCRNCSMFERGQLEVILEEMNAACTVTNW